MYRYILSSHKRPNSRDNNSNALYDSFTDVASRLSNEDEMYSRTLNQLLDSLLYDVHLNFSLGNSETAHVTVNYMMRLSNNYSSPKMFDHIGTAVSIQLAYGLLVEGNWDAVASQLSAVISRCTSKYHSNNIYFPGFADSLIMLTETYASLNKFDEALHCARLCVEVAHEAVDMLEQCQKRDDPLVISKANARTASGDVTGDLDIDDSLIFDDEGDDLLNEPHAAELVESRLDKGVSSAAQPYSNQPMHNMGFGYALLPLEALSAAYCNLASQLARVDATRPLAMGWLQRAVGIVTNASALLASNLSTDGDYYRKCTPGFETALRSYADAYSEKIASMPPQSPSNASPSRESVGAYVTNTSTPPPTTVKLQDKVDSEFYLSPDSTAMEPPMPKSPFTPPVSTPVTANTQRSKTVTPSSEYAVSRMNTIDGVEQRPFTITKSKSDFGLDATGTNNNIMGSPTTSVRRARIASAGSVTDGLKNTSPSNGHHGKSYSGPPRPKTSTGDSRGRDLSFKLPDDPNTATKDSVISNVPLAQEEYYDMISAVHNLDDDARFDNIENEQFDAQARAAEPISKDMNIYDVSRYRSLGEGIEEYERRKAQKKGVSRKKKASNTPLYTPPVHKFAPPRKSISNMPAVKQKGACFSPVDALIRNISRSKSNILKKDTVVAVAEDSAHNRTYFGHGALVGSIAPVEAPSLKKTALKKTLSRSDSAALGGRNARSCLSPIDAKTTDNKTPKSKSSKNNQVVVNSYEASAATPANASPVLTAQPLSPHKPPSLHVDAMDELEEGYSAEEVGIITRLQAVGRGYIGRKFINAVRYQKAFDKKRVIRRGAVVCIQRYFRGCSARRRLRKRDMTSSHRHASPHAARNKHAMAYGGHEVCVGTSIVALNNELAVVQQRIVDAVSQFCSEKSKLEHIRYQLLTSLSTRKNTAHATPLSSTVSVPHSPERSGAVSVDMDLSVHAPTLSLQLKHTHNDHPPPLKFEKGHRIEAKFLGSRHAEDGSGHVGAPVGLNSSLWWHPGKVMGLDHKHNSYDVLYVNGTVESGVPARYVRQRHVSVHGAHLTAKQLDQKKVDQETHKSQMPPSSITRLELESGMHDYMMHFLTRVTGVTSRYTNQRIRWRTRAVVLIQARFRGYALRKYRIKYANHLARWQMMRELERQQLECNPSVVVNASGSELTTHQMTTSLISKELSHLSSIEMVHQQELQTLREEIYGLLSKSSASSGRVNENASFGATDALTPLQDVDETVVPVEGSVVCSPIQSKRSVVLVKTPPVSAPPTPVSTTPVESPVETPVDRNRKVHSDQVTPMQEPVPQIEVMNDVRVISAVLENYVSRIVDDVSARLMRIAAVVTVAPLSPQSSVVLSPQHSIALTPATTRKDYYERAVPIDMLISRLASGFVDVTLTNVCRQLVHHHMEPVVNVWNMMSSSSPMTYFAVTFLSKHIFSASVRLKQQMDYPLVNVSNAVPGKEQRSVFLLPMSQPAAPSVQLSSGELCDDLLVCLHLGIDASVVVDVVLDGRETSLMSYSNGEWASLQLPSANTSLDPQELYLHCSRIEWKEFSVYVIELWALFFNFVTDQAFYSLQVEELVQQRVLGEYLARTADQPYSGISPEAMAHGVEYVLNRGRVCHSNFIDSSLKLLQNMYDQLSVWGFDDRFISGLKEEFQFPMVDESAGVDASKSIKKRFFSENILYLHFQTVSTEIYRHFLDIAQESYSVGEQLHDFDGLDIWESWGNDILQGYLEFFESLKLSHDVGYSCHVDAELVRDTCVSVMDLGLQKLRRNSHPVTLAGESVVNFGEDSTLSCLFSSTPQLMSHKSILFHKQLDKWEELRMMTATYDIELSFTGASASAGTAPLRPQLNAVLADCQRFMFDSLPDPLGSLLVPPMSASYHSESPVHIRSLNASVLSVHDGVPVGACVDQCMSEGPAHMDDEERCLQHQKSHQRLVLHSAIIEHIHSFVENCKSIF